MRKIVKEGYDQIGRQYHKRRLRNAADNYAYFDALRDQLPASGRVLDLGCGGGIPVAKYFVDRNYSVTGIDISEEMVAIAREAVPKAQFFVADMCTFAIEPHFFDLIVSTFAIVHVPREEQYALFEKIFRGLRNGGRAYLVLGEKDREAETKEDWHGVSMFWSSFSPTKYDALLEEIGFDMVWSEKEIMGNGEQFYTVLLQKREA